MFASRPPSPKNIVYRVVSTNSLSDKRNRQPAAADAWRPASEGESAGGLPKFRDEGGRMKDEKEKPGSSFPASVVGPAFPSLVICPSVLLDQAFHPSSFCLHPSVQSPRLLRK